MKRIFTIVIAALISYSAAAQSTGDTVVIRDIVRQQIIECQQKQQISEPQPAKTTKPAETKAMPISETVQRSSVAVSETQFILLFAIVEIVFAAVLIRRIYLKRAAKKQKPAVKDNGLPSPGNRRYISREEFAKTRSDLVCKLSLVKTKEDLVRQAKKMNMGTGELELALRLQEMGKGTA